ncbi:sarcosine oxidase subunit delta [Aliiroseovarius subalbicans]|uniref:sarcosine oxidase subunit delta n=1 Tax=Aliiroseovarius subalbicans TaxID=2925840 RepID=UPI001F5684F8|nr:sarcosine oxidase subunit delta [Aliiroseovarius subalbicans]MCI2398587.1 sarcosine oxidase subunit delta [Aliiroseovarius subalbicans]
MRIPCPLCGDRDHREFTYKGAAVALDRPGNSDWSDDWDSYIHLRDNPAGDTDEMWWHGAGCGGWLVVTRNTVTHEVKAARMAADVKGAGA